MRETPLSSALQARNWEEVKRLINAGSALTYTHTFTPDPQISSLTYDIAIQNMESGPIEKEVREIEQFISNHHPCINDLRALHKAIKNINHIEPLTIEKQNLSQEINSAQNGVLSLLAIYLLTAITFTGVAGCKLPLIMSFTAIAMTPHLSHSHSLTEFYQNSAISIKEKILDPINSWSTQKKYTVSHMSID